MREIVLVVAIIGALSACGKDPESNQAAPSVVETKLVLCSVEKTEAGALVSCPDGTSVEIKGGPRCSADIKKGKK